MSSPLPALSVSWRLVRADDTLPPPEDAAAWLSPAERDRARALRVEKRRHDWVLGRLNLKALIVSMVAARFGVRLAPADVLVERRPSGAPFVRLGPEAHAVDPAHQPGARLPLEVSNSHSNGRALGAAFWTDAWTSSGLAWGLGVDLEWVEPRSDAFVRDFLTVPERQYCNAGTGAERHLRANLVWSAKEAVLKVLQRGLSADTWWVTCLPSHAEETPGAETPHALPGPGAPRPLLDPASPPWASFSVACDARLQADHARFTGRWCTLDGFVLTLAVGTMPLRSTPPGSTP